MQTNKKLQKATQTIAKFERQLSLEKIKQRKADTRRKIEFGGLVIKAKMDHYAKDIILGALLHVQKELEKEAGTKLLYQSIGRSAFMEQEDNNR